MLKFYLEPQAKQLSKRTFYSLLPEQKGETG